MRSLLRFIGVFTALAVGVGGAACSGDAVVDPAGSGGSTSTSNSTNSSSSSSSAGGTTSNGGAGGMAGCSLNGDCQQDSECPGAARCVPISDCGFKVCETLIDEATSCPDPAIDICCNSSECTNAGESCHSWPFGAQCGGVQPQVHNVCVADQCQTDSDCPDTNAPFIALCAPANTFGTPVRQCMRSNCLVDGDCAAEPGGVCAPVQTACCSNVNAVACVYASDGCRRDSDCGNDSHCDVDTNGDARCVQGPAICPA